MPCPSCNAHDNTAGATAVMTCQSPDLCCATNTFHANTASSWYRASVRLTHAHVQVEPGTIWCFEQEQSLAGINVTTTIRMTVVKLQSGELVVYAPVAPTRYWTTAVS